MARTSISSCAFLFLILTSLLFHNLFAAPIFTHPPAQPPTLSPSPAPTPEPGVPPASPPPPPQSSNPAAPPPPPPTGSGGNGSPGKEKSVELSGGQTAGVVIGVLAALGLLVLGSLVYKKRRYNIRRSRYGSAARRASL